jgi:hypothetical protein
VQRAADVFERRTPKNDSARSERETVLATRAICCLACFGFGCPSAAGRAVTRNQVELMQVDTVASPSLPGFVELGISPRPMEVVLGGMLRP